MPAFNRRVALFILLDAVILLGLAGLFVAVRHAMSPSSSPQSAAPVERNILPTPSMAAVPQTIAALKPTGDLTEAGPGDAINLQRLIAKNVKVDVHSIQMGENYWSIAKKNNIDIYTLIGANPTLPFKARIKQTLNILQRKGVLYTVLKGDDLSKIAANFGTDVKTLKAENYLHWWRHVREGDVLFIPGVKPILMLKEWKDYYSRRGIFGDPLGRWGRINSNFGPRIDPLTGDVRHHNGVDLKAKYGDPVYAAASGKVVFTGVNGGYGNLIIIAHANGYNTYYGHLSKIYAKVGQKVHRGAGIIGRVGATGRVTGPHLHFEIRKNGKAIDPLLMI